MSVSVRIGTGRGPRTIAAALAVLLATSGSTVTNISLAESNTASDSAGLVKFEQGKKAYDASDWAGALAAFQASLELLPSPNTRLYIARCFRQLGRFASAFTQYDLAAREATDRIATSGEKRYSATVQAATEESAAIAADVPHLVVSVPEVVPDDLEIRLDGRQLPRASWGAAVAIDPGKHVVTATGKRLVPFAFDVTLAVGGNQKVAVAVKALPTATFRLSLVLQPQGIAISMDGQAVDLASSLHGMDLDPGMHHLVVKAPGYRDFAWDGRLEDGDGKTIAVQLESDGVSHPAGTPRWLFYTVGTLSVVTLAAGSIFAVQAKSDSDREKAKDPLARDPSAPDDIRSTSTRANVLFVAGGVFAVATGVLFFTTRWSATDQAEPKTATSNVAPWVAPSAAGLSLAGAF